MSVIEQLALPIAVMATDTCQVRRVGLDRLTCTARESGGVRCEVIGPHAEHAVGEHTKEHMRAGNGWSCDFTSIRVPS